MANEVTPASTSGGYLLVQNWQRRILGAVYEQTDALKMFNPVAEKLDDSLWIRRMGRVAGTELASSATGAGLTPSDPGTSRVQISPHQFYSYIQHPDSMEYRGGKEVRAAFADTVEMGLAKALELYVCTLFATATNAYGAVTDDVEVVGLRTVLQTVATNSKNRGKPGAIRLLLGNSQMAASLAIEEINRADIRGDGTSPQVSGRMAKGLGFMFDYSTNLYSDTNGTHGAAFMKDAIHYGWNKEPKGETQRFELSTKILASAEIGAARVFEEFMVDYRHKP